VAVAASEHYVVPESIWTAIRLGTRCCGYRWSRADGRPSCRTVSVINLDTGEQYPSVTAAANAHYVSHSAIVTAIKRQGTSCGYRWGYADA
jgi:hypothetical protein